MTVDQAIRYIEDQQWSATRLGLGRTRELLRRLGDPQNRLRFVHVAGSNGKGSTCAMLASILHAAGIKTGLYTSPHLVRFQERFQIDGRAISDEQLAALTERVKDAAEQMADHPSQFELATAIAMLYFDACGCDLVVLEVGMGGALDATNVIPCPEAAVITNIGLEHTEYLGATLREIALTKGGIIKPGGRAVCYESDPAVMQTLKEMCASRHAAFLPVPPDDALEQTHDLSGQTITRRGRSYFLPLLGAHQVRNAAVALQTVDVLRDRGWHIPESAVAQGLRDTRWPARFEVLSRQPLFILDGGHNPQCADALARNLAQYLPGTPVTFLLGLLRDKACEQIVRSIAPYAAEFVCVTPESDRALSGEELCGRLTRMGLPATACDRIEDGIAAALQTEKPVVAFGSLYMAGAIRACAPRILSESQQ